MRSLDFSESFGPGNSIQMPHEAYVALLSRIPPIGETVEARLVQLIWFAPMFIEWQLGRAAKSEDELRQLTRIATQVHEAVSNILGIP